MTKLKIAVLIISVLWVCGSLPSVVIGQALCQPTPGIGCANPETFEQELTTILSLDVLLVAISSFTLAQMRQQGRSPKS